MVDPPAAHRHHREAHDHRPWVADDGVLDRGQRVVHDAEAFERPAALVESWSPAIDNVLAAGEITEAEAEQYRQALADAFTFRVTWNGEDATPSFAGLNA